MRPPGRFNFSADGLAPLARERGHELALMAVDRDGHAERFSFAQAASHTARAASALAALGVERGDVVMTVVGSRAEWVWLMAGCWHMGAVALPCNEMLRAGDLRQRLEIGRPRLVVSAARDLDEVRRAAESLAGEAPEPIELERFGELMEEAVEPPPAATAIADPALVIFTSGT